MNTYNDTYQRLAMFGFVQKEDEHFVDLGVVWFSNKNINVILEYSDSGTDAQKIKAACLAQRDILLELGVNVWNSYYLLCSNENQFDDEFVYTIEHDPVAMRKYVIRSTNDLRRIPFLDNSSGREQPLHKLTAHQDENLDEVVRSLISFILENEGTEIRFNPQMVQDAICAMMTIPRKETT